MQSLLWGVPCFRPLIAIVDCLEHALLTARKNLHTQFVLKLVGGRGMLLPRDLGAIGMTEIALTRMVGACLLA